MPREIPDFLLKGKSNTQIKARKSFNYQCDRASDCRHDKYIQSCAACPEKDDCDIQAKIEEARRKM